MNSLDKRAGRIHAFQPLLLDLVVNFLCYAVGADHDHALFDLSELFFCLNYRNAFFFKIADHLFIVDDRAISVYFCAGLRQLVHPVYRTLYAKAKARAFCKQNFHLFLISAHAFFAHVEFVSSVRRHKSRDSKILFFHLFLAPDSQQPFSAQISRIRSTTSSIERSEVSRSTASSACFNGAIALVISCISRFLTVFKISS